MGLFSSKYSITASASTMNLVAVEADPLVSVVLSAVVREEGMSGALLTYMHSGLAVSIPRIHNYARDEYTLGLPQGQAFNYSSLDPHVIDDVLLIEKGGTSTYLSIGSTYVALTPAIVVYPHLYNNRHYNRFTGLIGNPPVGIVWQQSEDPGSLVVDTANKRVHFKSASVAADGVSIDIIYSLYLERPVIKPSIDPQTLETNPYATTIEMQYILEPYTHTENVPIAGLADLVWGEEYLSVFYKEYTDIGVLVSSDQMWLYRISTNVYPELNPIDSTTSTLDYFPVIPLRYNNQDLTSGVYKERPLYDTSKRMAKLSKLDIDLLAGKLNENPNIAYIDHAYVMCGINVRTKTKACIAYLHKFFEYLYLEQYSDELDYLNKLGTVPYHGTTPVNSLLTRVPGSTGIFEENGLNIHLSFDFITSTLEAGTVGNGKVSQVDKSFYEYQEEVLVDYVGPDGVISLQPQQITKGAMVLKLQVAENVVHIISVHGLEHANFIYGQYGEFTSILDVVRNPDENNMVIPLQFQMLMNLNFRLRSDVYNDSLLMIINTYDVQKAKWYQTGWFKVIIIIVLIVIAAVRLVYGDYTALLDTIEAMTALELLVGLASYVAQYAIVGLIISVAAKYIVKEFGAQIGILGSIVLAAASIAVTGYGDVNILNSGLMTAQICMQASTALISTSNEFLVEAGEKIKNEFEVFENKLAGLYEELKVTTDLMELNNIVDPLMFAAPAKFKICYESPTQFFTRCLELPTYTMATIHEQIPNYCSTLLKLPKPANSMYARA